MAKNGPKNLLTQGGTYCDLQKDVLAGSKESGTRGNRPAIPEPPARRGLETAFRSRPGPQVSESDQTRFLRDDITKRNRGRRSASMFLCGDVVGRDDLHSLIEGGLARLIARKLIASGVRPDRVYLSGTNMGRKKEQMSQNLRPRS